MKKFPLRVTLLRIGEPLLADYEFASTAIDSPKALHDFWRNLVAVQPDHEADKENLVAVALNTRLKATSWHLVALGSQNECIAHPREIFRTAIIQNAYGLILAHNHPSGDPAPSEADRRLTKRLTEAAEILQIRLLDHVVIGNPDHYSFREAGLI